MTVLVMSLESPIGCSLQPNTLFIISLHIILLDWGSSRLMKQTHPLICGILTFCKSKRKQGDSRVWKNTFICPSNTNKLDEDDLQQPVINLKYLSLLTV